MTDFSAPMDLEAMFADAARQGDLAKMDRISEIQRRQQDYSGETQEKPTPQERGGFLTQISGMNPFGVLSNLFSQQNQQ
jgi:hypothetical protein